MMAQLSGLVSVVVPCRGQIGFTRECVQALVRHTTAPWEMIVVDDGSTDGTADYAIGLADASPMPVRVLRHSKPRGFPAACNAGMRAARGAYFVLLNNDAVVTNGWADQLVALLRSDPSIGLVGPMSNYAAPPQLVPDVPYGDLAGMHAYATRWRAERLGQWFTCSKLSGFCLMLTREVYERLGGLDERFGLGFFDDDDLAERARRAGYQLAVAHDLFVHHFGSRTFQGLGIDAGGLLRENMRTFAEKWGQESVAGLREVEIAPWGGGGRNGDWVRAGRGAGHTEAIAGPVQANYPAVPLPQNGESHLAVADPVPSSIKRTVRVSLTMIVRNEEQNLPHCLASVAGVFDEVVVLDTGSTDRTRDIAREHGARVFDFVWVDDFAAARNAALARATGDYAFWLDADDVVEPPEREKLLRLLASLRAGDEAAFVVRCACDPDENGGGGQTVVDHVRLFPVRENVRWTYRVHEQILPSLRQAGCPVRWTDLAVRHTGYSDAATRARKLARDERILVEEMAEAPHEPFVLFNLGSIAIERKDWEQALEYLERSLKTSRAEDSITRKTHALIARAHQGLCDLDAALSACELGLASEPDDAELHFRKAVALLMLDRPGEAESCWRRVLTLRRPERFSSVDQGIFGHLTRRNLGVLAAARGDVQESARQWRAVLAECPGDAEALARLRHLEREDRPGREVQG